MRHMLTLSHWSPVALDRIKELSLKWPTGARYLEDSYSGTGFYVFCLRDEMIIMAVGDNGLPTELVFEIVGSCGSAAAFLSMTEKRGDRRLFTGTAEQWKQRLGQYPFCVTSFQNTRCTKCDSYLKVVKPHLLEGFKND